MAQHTRESADYDLLQLPDLIRAIRYWRCLSQRELARLAGLPQTTLARLESGKTADPALSTVQRVLAGAELSLITVDFDGQPISHFSTPGMQRDSAGRHLPAHLERRPLDDAWWGWYRIAWEYTNEPRPAWIYNKRRPGSARPYD